MTTTNGTPHSKPKADPAPNWVILGALTIICGTILGIVWMVTR